MSSSQSKQALLGDLPGAFSNLFNAQMQFGADLFESLTGRPMPKLGDVSKLGRELVSGGSSCKPRSGCCTIPPPCWMPQPLGECTSHVSQCKTACVRFVVTNCDRVQRAITVQATGAGAQMVTLSPTSLSLAPFERGSVSACIAIHDDAKVGDRIESLIWIRGCKEHYFRWTVSVGTAGLDSCHEIEVCDCPDLVHHWYDHFYCARPCPHGVVGGVGNVKTGFVTGSHG